MILGSAMAHTPQAKVLFVTRRRDIAAMSGTLGALGYEATMATETEEALGWISSHAFQAILVDLYLTGKQDLWLLEAAIGSPAAPAVIACAAESSVEFAVAVMRAGASDFFTGSFSVDALLASLR